MPRKSTPRWFKLRCNGSDDFERLVAIIVTRVIRLETVNKMNRRAQFAIDKYQNAKDGDTSSDSSIELFNQYDKFLKE